MCTISITFITRQQVKQRSGMSCVVLTRYRSDRLLRQDWKMSMLFVYDQLSRREESWSSRMAAAAAGADSRKQCHARCETVESITQGEGLETRFDAVVLHVACVA